MIAGFVDAGWYAFAATRNEMVHKKRLNTALWPVPARGKPSGDRPHLRGQQWLALGAKLRRASSAEDASMPRRIVKDDEAGLRSQRSALVWMQPAATPDQGCRRVRDAAIAFVVSFPAREAERASAARQAVGVGDQDLVGGGSLTPADDRHSSRTALFELDSSTAKVRGSRAS